MKISFDDWRDCLFKDKIINFFSENKIQVHQHLIASVSNFSNKPLSKPLQLRRNVEITEIIKRVPDESEWKYTGKFRLIDPIFKKDTCNLKLLLSTLNLYNLYIAYIENSDIISTKSLPKFSFVKIMFNYNYKYLSYIKVDSNQFNVIDDLILVKNINYWQECEDSIFPSDNFGGFFEFFENINLDVTEFKQETSDEFTIFMNIIKTNCDCSIINPTKEKLLPKKNIFEYSSMNENFPLEKLPKLTIPDKTITTLTQTENEFLQSFINASGSINTTVNSVITTVNNGSSVVNVDMTNWNVIKKVMLDTQIRLRENKWIEEMELKFKKRELIVVKDANFAPLGEKSELFEKSSSGNIVLFWKGLLCMESYGKDQKLWLGFKENFTKHCIRKTVFICDKTIDKRKISESDVKQPGIYALSSKNYTRSDGKIRNLWEHSNIFFHLNW